MVGPITLKEWGKGVNRDQPPHELAPGFWSDGRNVRFRAGEAERVGGIASVITPSGTPQWIMAYSSGTIRYAVYASLTKAYAHDGATETDITRLDTTSAKKVTNLSRTGTTVTLVTDTAHGLSTGNVVTVYGANYRPGYNGTYPITVTNGTTFTYTSAVNKNDMFSPGQLASVGYTPPSPGTINFTGSADDKITGGNSNGVLVYNNPVDGLFYWDQVNTSKLVPMQGFAGNKCDAARPFKNYLLCLAPTISGVKLRHTVLWSSAADPGTVPLYFTASSSNDAGQQDLVSDGEMVDCREWGEDMILYKRDARFRMRYIGGNYVFDLQLISGNHRDDGLLAANCIANTPKGQVFITDGHDIRIHTGGESVSIAFGRVLNYFRNAIDPAYRKRAFLAVNPYCNEVWVCFPEVGKSVCTRALIWNWEDDTWGDRDLPNVTAGASGELPLSIAQAPRMVVATNTPRIGLVDSGTTDFGASYTTTLERIGMDMDSTGFKTLHESMPRFTASTNFTASVYHGSSTTQNGIVTYAAPQTYTHNTTARVSAFAYSGRYLAWKMTTAASDTPKLRSIDFWINEDGEY